MTWPDSGARTPRWRTIAAVWLACGLFDAAQTVLVMRAVGKSAWLALFVTELASWLPWVLATPFIIDLARRHPITSDSWRSGGIRHVARFLVVALVAGVWFAVLKALFNPWREPVPPTLWQAWETSFPYQLLPFLIVYAMIVAITYLLDARERGARLNEELAKAQLAALRAQLEPHFIFNAMNSIAGLVREQRHEAAVQMLVGLSEFMRRATQDSQRAQVTLAEEMDYLRLYVDIQKVRFGGRLQVSNAIPDELLTVQVPVLLLQPLVENAIKHGVGRRVAGGAVHISGRCDGNTVSLSVRNDGPDAAPEACGTHTGVGLSNLRTRLSILHGAASGLHLRLTPSGEAEVVVTLPFREA